MTRKVQRGQPLTELVKGSLDYTVQEIRRAFYDQFRRTRDVDEIYDAWIVETFADHVIVHADKLKSDEFYFVPFQRVDGRYVFAARDDWEVVELAYRPQTIQENRSTNKQQRLVERLDERVHLAESEDGQPRRIKAVGITADVINGNGRRYPAAVLRDAVEEAKTHLHESLGQGRMLLLGEAEHPSDKRGRPNILETVVKWEGIDFDGQQILLEGILLPTSKGKDISALMENGVLPGVSQRAYGMSKTVKEGKRSIEEITELHITGYDLVLEPSDPAGRVTLFEHQEEQEQMDPITLEKLRQEYPELVAQIEREHDEKERAKLEEALQRRAEEDHRIEKELERRMAALREKLGLKETDNLEESVAEREARLQALEEAEAKRQVAAYVAEQTKDLKYPTFLKEQFLEAVKSTAPTTIDEAKAAIIAKRREYDGIMAALELRTQGYGGQMLGAVLERERGVPEYAVVAHELTESLVRAGQVPERNLRKPRNINERFAASYLALFDEKYRHLLEMEARAFEEASITTDLNLPYSVTRTVVAEALPQLVATSIFDVQTTDQAPTRIYYERYEGETGSTGTATDESITASPGTPVQLANRRLHPGSMVVTSDPAGTTYAEGTDFVVDYGDGQVTVLPGGAIADGAALLVDYTFDAIRKGEMAPIARAKMALVSKTLEVMADRLAMQISREAVVFSRSQIGWDAVTRTLTRLIERVARMIDQGIFYEALTAVMQVGNNSGGTWNSGVDTLDDLMQMIGYAKVKVANRFYDPTFILTSVANADHMSNWQGFKRDGFPSAELDPAGYAGSVKGLPIFQSTQFPDSHIVVGNRELVVHRVFQPMQLRGPFPSFDPNGFLIAADQYYVEEFNGTDAPVPEKGAYVRIG
jgi:hypothetical protein